LPLVAGYISRLWIIKSKGKKWFEENDLDYENHTFIRREVNPQGKSRAFINDTPVTLKILKELGDKIVDIHTQHNTVAINYRNFQLAAIDSYAGLSNDVEQYRNQYDNFIKELNRLSELIENERKYKADRDYFQFLFHELDSAGLIKGEQEKHEQELGLLNHTEDIKSGLGQSLFSISQSENCILNQMAEIVNQLGRLTDFHTDIKKLFERLQSNYIDIKDIADDIDRIEQSTTLNPDRIIELNDRLSLLYNLQQKHNVQSVEELISICKELDVRLQDITSLDQQISDLKEEVEQKKKALFQKAKQLSEARVNAIPEIEMIMMESISNLGMADAKFRIQHQHVNEPGREGIDKVTFLFNANKGEALNEIVSVASGGELSRLMLSIKSMISRRNLLPTIIFDEIDLGVSGHIADKIGQILQELSKSMQVIAITHLPQIAGKGDVHYHVVKVTESESTHTKIRILKNSERVDEIAKMLSGINVTQASLVKAKELLHQLN